VDGLPRPKPPYPHEFRARIVELARAGGRTIRRIAQDLTLREAAERLAVSTATVYALCDRGELPHVRISNAIRITPADLAAFLARFRAK
jgi:excisionase family DNA binding protein